MPNHPKAAPHKAPTIIDIARVAGTSKSTVSNVLRGKEHVEAATRARVMQAVQELGYRANIAARHLRQRPKVLGLVVGDLRNPFNAEIVACIEERATAVRHTILLVTTSGLAEREAARLETLLEHRVAAVLFLTFSGDTAVLSMLPPDTPSLFVGFRGSGVASISVDERKGARLAVEHLTSLGHQRIAYVSTRLDPRTDATRFASYRASVKSHGIDANQMPVMRIRAEEDTAPDLVGERLAALLSGPDRPTAIFAASDFTAIRAMGAADAARLEIPRDLSIVSFDDIALAGLSRIALTTIAQPMAELADRAVSAAIERLDDGAPIKDVLLAPRLVVRSSTAPPRSDTGPRRRSR